MEKPENSLTQALEPRLKIPKSLDSLLQKDGFVIFIGGRKEAGKTDLALNLAAYCYDKAYRINIATNIWTENYRIERQITNFPDFKDWIMTKGKKLFILDEAGKHLKRRRPLSDRNILLMDIIQLIRHYDAGFIGIAPSDIFIDKQFMNTDVLDARIKKLSKTTAIIKDYLDNATYFLLQIPRTTIKFDTKDIAEFTSDKKIPLEQYRLCCQVAKVYAETQSYRAVKNTLRIKNDNEIRRLLIEHLKHADLQLTPQP